MKICVPVTHHAYPVFKGLEKEESQTQKTKSEKH